MKASQYISDREETIDMEIPRRSFEHLVEVDDLYTKMWQDQRDEIGRWGSNIEGAMVARAVQEVTKRIANGAVHKHNTIVSQFQEV